MHRRPGRRLLAMDNQLPVLGDRHRSGNMSAALNPYAPPQTVSTDLRSFASRYRVDTSKTTIREFQNLSGRPIVGAFVWLAARAGLARLNGQIIDGPKAFAEDQCELDDLRDPVRSHLQSICDSAGTLGFHSPVYSVSDSTGVEVHGGAIRMLRDSGRSFLQILASSSEALMQGYEIVVSATSPPVSVFSTTNGPPNYNLPVGVTTHRHVGRTLHELLDSHKRLTDQIDNLMVLQSFADVGAVMDHLSWLFYTDKIARGIFVEEPEP